MVINSNRFNFKDVVGDYLNNTYYPQVVEAVTEVIPEVAKEAVKKLKSESPKGKTGEYAKKWTSKVETGRITVGATVYGNAPTYRLAHLLEYGHVKRGGKGRVGARPHIASVEEWATEEAYERIMYKIGGAG